jgi:antitoxin (DNA-binding transcriptional repressor) of toxin-antitoxin stability system
MGSGGRQIPDTGELASASLTVVELDSRLTACKLSLTDLVYTPMLIINIHEAKTQLSRLVDNAVKGEAFVIAKAGKPLVKVSALESPEAPKRLGFLAGEIAVPRDFNTLGEKKIGKLFGNED